MRIHQIPQLRLIATVLPALIASSALGQIWTQTSAPTTNWSSVASSADGSTLVAAVNGGLTYVSTNSGATWRQTSAPGDTWTCVASSADGKCIMAGRNSHSLNGQFCTSTDSGETWVTTNKPGFGFTSIASSADGTKLAATYTAGTSVYFSTNCGTTWRSLTAYVNPGRPIFDSAVISADGRIVAASWGTLDTERGIVVWSVEGTNQPAKVLVLGHGLGGNLNLACSADGTRLVTALVVPGQTNCPSMLFASADTGATWTTFCTPVEAWTAVACSADGTKLVAAAASGEIYRSRNIGATWEPITAPTGNWVSIASSADLSLQWREAASTLAKPRPHPWSTWVRRAPTLWHPGPCRRAV